MTWLQSSTYSIAEIEALSAEARYFFPVQPLRLMLGPQNENTRFSLGDLALFFGPEVACRYLIQTDWGADAPPLETLALRLVAPAVLRCLSYAEDLHERDMTLRRVAGESMNFGELETKYGFSSKTPREQRLSVFAGFIRIEPQGVYRVRDTLKDAVRAAARAEGPYFPPLLHEYFVPPSDPSTFKQRLHAYREAENADAKERAARELRAETERQAQVQDFAAVFPPILAQGAVI